MLLADVYRDSLWLGGVTVGNEGCKAFLSAVTDSDFFTQAILKRSLKPTCSVVPLMKRGHANNLEFFLSNVGRIFMNG